MLGPRDVADWQMDADDALAARLRQHPCVRTFLRHPDHPTTHEAIRVAPLLGRFIRQELLSPGELRTLAAIMGPAGG